LCHFQHSLVLPSAKHPDMLPYTRENIFSSTDLLKNNSENLSGPVFAAQAVRRPSGISTKRRKARKVLYPAHVRKYLPREKKDPVKRWLLFCAGIILIQVLTEVPDSLFCAPEPFQSVPQPLLSSHNPSLQPFSIPKAPQPWAQRPWLQHTSLLLKSLGL
uniref:Uncharacterized protein n=1 Tax=Junco hyemalis TaxID=40217 RepID=A0A8C5JR06_JUNHY